MTLDEVHDIERRLSVSLPAAYRKALLDGVSISGSSPEPYFSCEWKELILTNLELRMPPIPNCFCGREWPLSYVCIGNDGCGNYYAIDCNDPCCSVRFFDHEADTFDIMARSIPDFLAYMTEVIQSVSRLRPPTTRLESRPPGRIRPPPAAVVTRAEDPRESVLHPIALLEWTAFVAADADLELREYKTLTNPFKGEEIRLAIPGLAIFRDRQFADEFNYVFGRIVVSRPSLVAIDKLKHTAEILNARFATNW